MRIHTASAGFSENRLLGFAPGGPDRPAPGPEGAPPGPRKIDALPRDPGGAPGVRKDAVGRANTGVDRALTRYNSGASRVDAIRRSQPNRPDTQANRPNAPRPNEPMKPEELAKLIKAEVTDMPEPEAKLLAEALARCPEDVSRATVLTAKELGPTGRARLKTNVATIATNPPNDKSTLSPAEKASYGTAAAKLAANPSIILTGGLTKAESDAVLHHMKDLNNPAVFTPPKLTDDDMKFMTGVGDKFAANLQKARGEIANEAGPNETREDFYMRQMSEGWEKFNDFNQPDGERWKGAFRALSAGIGLFQAAGSNTLGQNQREYLQQQKEQDQKAAGRIDMNNVSSYADVQSVDKTPPGAKKDIQIKPKNKAEQQLIADAMTSASGIPPGTVEKKGNDTVLVKNETDDVRKIVMSVLSGMKANAEGTDLVNGPRQSGRSAKVSKVEGSVTGGGRSIKLTPVKETVAEATALKTAVEGVLPGPGGRVEQNEKILTVKNGTNLDMTRILQRLDEEAGARGLT